MRALLRLIVALIAVGFMLAPPNADAGRVVRHGTISCDTTASGVLIVAANENRSAPLYIFNTAAGTVYTGSGLPSALTSSNGIPLLQNTGRYVSDGSSKPYTGAYRCITASGSSDIRYEEVLD